MNQRIISLIWRRVVNQHDYNFNRLSLDPYGGIGMRFLIEEAKCDLSDYAKEGGIVPGATVASVRYSTGSESKWLHCMDFESMLSFYSTEEDLFDILMDDEMTSEDIDHIERFRIDSFCEIGDLEYITVDDLDLDCLFDEEGDPDLKSVYGMLCYILVMINCPYDVTDECISLGIGKHSDELDFGKLLSLMGPE